MLARGRLSKKIFFAYFVFRGSIGIYQSDQTSRIVKKIINQCTLMYMGVYMFMNFVQVNVHIHVCTCICTVKMSHMYCSA